MSYEKNCAVAKKLGYYIHKQNTIACLVDKGEGYIPSMKHFDPCNDPRDYMMLVEEYEINIEFDYVGGVFCEWISNNYTKTFPKDQTGYAVVDAFLQMEIEK